MAWIDILQYRDFWDEPKVFLVRHRDRMLLFDCPFDEEIEDFPKEYRIYLMPELTAADLSDSWEFLASKALKTLGSIPIKRVHFDETHRKQIESSILDELFAQKLAS